MKSKKWILFALALGMMSATAGYLWQVRHTLRLGPPGVLVGPDPIYDDQGRVAGQQSVILPETVLGAKARRQPITEVELDMLPKDTTFGRRSYRVSDDFEPTITVVLMGSHHESIHRPEVCLTGQGWMIDQSRRVSIPMTEPCHYNLPAIELTGLMLVQDKERHPMTLRAIYVYWLVSADKITDQQHARSWSVVKTMVEKRQLERWAYIACFATCLPGQEEVTFERLKRFIQASVPSFQVVPAGKLSPVATRQ